MLRISSPPQHLRRRALGRIGKYSPEIKAMMPVPQSYLLQYELATRLKLLSQFSPSTPMGVPTLCYGERKWLLRNNRLLRATSGEHCRQGGNKDIKVQTKTAIIYVEAVL